VDFAALTPLAEQSLVEQNCDTMKKSSSNKCKINVKFIYDSFDEMEVGGLFGKITIVKAADDVGVVTPDKSGRQRR